MQTPQLTETECDDLFAALAPGPKRHKITRAHSDPLLLLIKACQASASVHASPTEVISHTLFLSPAIIPCDVVSKNPSRSPINFDACQKLLKEGQRTSASRVNPVTPESTPMLVAEQLAHSLSRNRKANEGTPRLPRWKSALNPNGLHTRASYLNLTAEENASLASAVNEYGLDFSFIKAKYGHKLDHRFISAIREHFRKTFPIQIKEFQGGTLRTAVRWTAEEDVVLVEAVESHGLDFKRIAASVGSRLGDRSSHQIYYHFRRAFPDEFKKLQKDRGSGNPCTLKEDEALKRGALKHVKGSGRRSERCERILETENEVLGGRKWSALMERHYKLSLNSYN